MTAAALRTVRTRTDFEPELGLILGSGLSSVADRVEAVCELEYAELPGFPRAGVAGHAGRLVLGALEGRRVCAFRGRFHFYEGHSMHAVASPVRLLEDLGGRLLVVTNSAGSLNRRFAPGELMLIADHLNLTWDSPLVGRRPGEVRDMFPDMSEPYDGALREFLRQAALSAAIPLVEGVYAGVAGPSYETRAEIELLRRAGADAVGMSTVPEVIAARERGLRVAGVSCLTNYAAGFSARRLTHDEVLEVAGRAASRLQQLLCGFLRVLPGGPSPRPAGTAGA